MGLFSGPIGQITKGMGKLGILIFVIFYVISPIDLMPEALLGPLGIIDDFFVIIFGFSFLGLDAFKTAKKTRIKFQEK